MKKLIGYVFLVVAVVLSGLGLGWFDKSKAQQDSEAAYIRELDAQRKYLHEAYANVQALDKQAAELQAKLDEIHELLESHKAVPEKTNNSKLRKEAIDPVTTTTPAKN